MYSPSGTDGSDLQNASACLGANIVRLENSPTITVCQTAYCFAEATREHRGVKLPCCCCRFIVVGAASRACPAQSICSPCRLQGCSICLCPTCPSASGCPVPASFHVLSAGSLQETVGTAQNSTRVVGPSDFPNNFVNNLPTLPLETG